MAESDPEDGISVMEFIKKRKAAAAAALAVENAAKKKDIAVKKENTNNDKKRKRKDESSSEESGSESDDDDKPLGELLKKRKQENSKDVPKKSKSKKEDDSDDDKPKKKAAASSSGEKVSRGAKSAQAKKSSDFYSDTDKGKLVQSLLVRWWYAIVWPKPEEIGEPPAGYEALDGFPGVFICTRSDALGTIVDLRNKDNCPSLKNISCWPSQKIKDHCILAYEKQMEILKEQGEEDTLLYKNLRQELKEIKAINADKADKEAKKYLF